MIENAPVAAPMPSAATRIAVAVKPGERASERAVLAQILAQDVAVRAERVPERRRGALRPRGASRQANPGARRHRASKTACISSPYSARNDDGIEAQEERGRRASDGLRGDPARAREPHELGEPPRLGARDGRPEAA